jgi:acetylornithine deacetylase/succinyl-diaminopimelate desuccinylase-like protein
MSIVDVEVVDLLTDLVAIDSVNPDLSPGGAGEAEIARFVRDWAEYHGLRAELVDDPAGRPSVVIRGGLTAEGCRRLLLCAHLDTVEAGGMADRRARADSRRTRARLLGPGTVHAGLIGGGQETSTIPDVEWVSLTDTVDCARILTATAATLFDERKSS